MDTPIRTRIAHHRGDHHGEEETHATLGCGACYRLVGLGESAPSRQDRIDASRASAGRARWLDRVGKDLTGFAGPELLN